MFDYGIALFPIISPTFVCERKVEVVRLVKY